MTISIDSLTHVISIPQSFLSSLGGSSYALDTNALRLALRDWEDSEVGITNPPTHSHNTKVLLGGIEYARIIEILSPYTITFEELTPQYSVSLTGSNNNILDRTNLNSVAVRSNNSAGLVQMQEIQHNIYNGGIWVDQTNGTAGLQYPVGTPLMPVNNIVDARILAAARGFKQIYVLGVLTLGTGDNIEYMKLVGENAARTVILIQAGALSAGAEITDATVSGVFDGGLILRSCYAFDLDYINGFLFQCNLGGTFKLGGGAACNIMSCYSSGNELAIDMNGSGQSLNASGWYGDIRIVNKTGADSCKIHSSSTTVTLDATVTNGAGIHIDGVGELINESLVTPEHVGLMSNMSVADAVLAAAASTPIHSNTKKINSADVIGTGRTGDSWRGVGVLP